MSCWRSVEARWRFEADRASASARLCEPGSTKDLAASVATIESASGCPATSGCRAAGATPRPLVALHWGSTSTTSAVRPDLASPAARLIAVVVLPTPPFWLATLMILAIVDRLVRGVARIGIVSM